MKAVRGEATRDTRVVVGPRTYVHGTGVSLYVVSASGQLCEQVRSRRLPANKSSQRYNARANQIALLTNHIIKSILTYPVLLVASLIAEIRLHTDVATICAHEFRRRVVATNA